MLYQHTPHYQSLHNHQHFKVSRYRMESALMKYFYACIHLTNTTASTLSSETLRIVHTEWGIILNSKRRNVNKNLLSLILNNYNCLLFCAVTN